jgi:MoxR-like ATPase
MQERHVTVFGTSHALDDPFSVFATQNPIEMEGTYPLPEAQLDRFFFKLTVQMPDVADLAEILARTTGTHVARATAGFGAGTVREMSDLIKQVAVAEPALQTGAARRSCNPSRRQRRSVSRQKVRALRR